MSQVDFSYDEVTHVESIRQHFAPQPKSFWLDFSKCRMKCFQVSTHDFSHYELTQVELS